MLELGVPRQCRQDGLCYIFSEKEIIRYDVGCPAESIVSISTNCRFAPKFSAQKDSLKKDKFFENLHQKFQEHLRSGSFDFSCGDAITCYQFWKKEYLSLDPNIMFSIQFPNHWCNEECTATLHTVGTYDSWDPSDEDVEEKRQVYRPELTKSFKRIPINDETLDHTKVYDSYPWEDYIIQIGSSKAHNSKPKNSKRIMKWIEDFERKYNQRELLPIEYRNHLIRNGSLDMCTKDPLHYYVQGDPKHFATADVSLDSYVLGDLAVGAGSKLSDAYRESSSRGPRSGIIYLISGGCSISLFMVIRGPLKGYIFAENDGPTWFVCSNFATWIKAMHHRIITSYAWMIN